MTIRAVILTTALGRFASLILTEHVGLVTTAGASGIRSADFWRPFTMGRFVLLLFIIFRSITSTLAVTQNFKVDDGVRL